jgi:2-polyprenyl-3-methyl-5-hydroxy-6-metoxy-1,4-benzoquinol methylase
VNSNQYDVIVCSNVLEHVPYPTKFLQEIKSVMRSGTVLYIEIPLEEIMLGLNSPHEKLKMKRHWHEHINFFSERAMTELLNHCGLKLVRQHALRPQPNKNTATLLQIACTLP